MAEFTEIMKIRNRMSDEGIQFLVICIAIGIYYFLLTCNIYDVKKELKILSKKIDEQKEKQKNE